MYRHCIFCKADFGGNEVVEQFPVGRRLAFDAAQGRLWVVCRRCNRWNLSPLEERWEAIETCERIFRDTHTRLSTEHIGLARVREGTDLVRIGKPQRPEFAAWRYGPGLRRRVKAVLIGGGVALLPVGLIWSHAFLAVGAGAGLVGQILNLSYTIRHNTQVLVKLPNDRGHDYWMKRKHVMGVTIEEDREADGFSNSRTR